MGITANSSTGDLGGLVVQYIFALLEGNTDELQEHTLELKAKGFTDEEISSMPETLRFFTYGEHTGEDDSNDTGYGLVTLKNENYLMDGSGDSPAYIPKSNTALY